MTTAVLYILPGSIGKDSVHIRITIFGNFVSDNILPNLACQGSTILANFGNISWDKQLPMLGISRQLVCQSLLFFLNIKEVTKKLKYFMCSTLPKTTLIMMLRNSLISTKLVWWFSVVVKLSFGWWSLPSVSLRRCCRHWSFSSASLGRCLWYGWEECGGEESTILSGGWGGERKAWGAWRLRF